MHSYWSRLSCLTSVFIFALCVCGVWTYACGKLQELTAFGHFHVRNLDVEVPRFAAHPLYHSDAASLALTMDVDLRDKFTWSTSVLFVYLALDYPTTYRPRNEVIVWDKIIQSKEEAAFSLTARTSKYLMQDYSRGHLANANVTATLHYYQMPKTGILHKRLVGADGGRLTFTMPPTYRGRIGRS